MKHNYLILLIKKLVLGMVIAGVPLAPFAACAAEGLFPSATVLAPPAVQTKLPDFEFANLNGGALKSSDMKGKVIIIRFWATW